MWSNSLFSSSCPWFGYLRRQNFIASVSRKPILSFLHLSLPPALLLLVFQPLMFALTGLVIGAWQPSGFNYLSLIYLLPIQHAKDKAGWGLSRLESLWIVRTYSELNPKLFNFYLKLNAAGLVDAIVSEDSDSFCYGAQTVLRNFSIAPSGNFVEMFTASRSVFN